MSLHQQSWHLGEAFPVRVLALMLRDPEFLPKYHADIRHEYFEKPDFCHLAYLILKFFREREKIPTRDEVIDLIVEYARTYDKEGSLQMRQYLVENLDYCLNYAISDDSFVKEKVRRFGALQRIKATLLKTVSLLENEKPESTGEDILFQIPQMFDEACRSGAADDLGTRFDKEAERLPEVLQQDMIYGAVNKVPTGVQPLDIALNGGLGIPEIGVLAGPPNRGKSTNLCVFGANAARHFHNMHVAGKHKEEKAVIHITCEMIERDIHTKYAANLVDMDIDQIPLQPEKYHRLYQDRIGQIGRVHTKYFSPGTTTAEELKWYIAHLVMSEGVVPGLVVVDYADRLKGGEDDRFVGMGKIYDQLIAIATKFSCPVWTGSQINRAHSEAEIITGSGLAESWKKFESADVVVTLCQTNDEYDRSRMRLYTAKVRRGKAKQLVFCHSHPERCALYAMSDNDVKKAGLGTDGKSNEDADSLTKARQKVLDGKSQGNGITPGSPAALPTSPGFITPSGAPGNTNVAGPSVPPSPPVNA